MTADDPFDLERFVDAQKGAYPVALAELRAGDKRSHWMWFVFPQAAGLGSSFMAQKYAIGSLDEARAYLAHPVLGPRLLECTRAVLGVEGRALRQVFGSPDDLKFRSSMTLFERAAASMPGGGFPEFGQALERWCGGKRCTATFARLGG